MRDESAVAGRWPWIPGPSPEYSTRTSITHVLPDGPEGETECTGGSRVESCPGAVVRALQRHTSWYAGSTMLSRYHWHAPRIGRQCSILPIVLHSSVSHKQIP